MLCHNVSIYHFQAFVHVVGNIWDTNTHHAIETHLGASLLVEGNLFHKVRRMQADKTGGFLYLANDENQSACEEAFGEACLPNQYSSTKSLNRTEAVVLQDAVARGVGAINDARAAAVHCQAF